MKHIAIVKREINGSLVNSVNARDLHKYMEVGKDYSSWIKQQIDRLNVIENKHYIRLTQEGEKKIEYIVDFDTAKNIALISFTDKGQEVRDYFIGIEKQYQKQSHLQLDIQLKRLDALTEIAHETNSILNQHTKDIQEVKEYIEDDKKQRPISFSQQKILLDTKNRRVYEIANGDDKIVKSAHHKMWALFKRKFQIPRYSELPTYKFNDGVDYLKNLTLADLIA